MIELRLHYTPSPTLIHSDILLAHELVDYFPSFQRISGRRSGITEPSRKPKTSDAIYDIARIFKQSLRHAASAPFLLTILLGKVLGTAS